MKKLTLLVGPPGSGKSTLAKEYCSKGDIVHINQDKQGKEHLVDFALHVIRGDDIVVDRMNFNKDQRKRYLEPAKKAGYYTQIIVLHEPRQVCIDRMRVRTDHETIKDEKSASQALGFFFAKYERPAPDEADKIEFRYPDADKPFAIICDLDGTLCKIDHRLHFVRKPKGEKKDWKSFFEGILGDEVNDWCRAIVKSISTQTKAEVVFCSGRPDNYRRDTQAWLDTNGFGGIPLYMRPRNDQRDDSIVKEIILDFEILTRFTPYFMIDDRKRVVDMWRRRGFTCLHCADGEF